MDVTELVSDVEIERARLRVERLPPAGEGSAAARPRVSARRRQGARFHPKRVEYRREGDKLHGEISGPGEDGQEQTIPFDYVRCP